MIELVSVDRIPPQRWRNGGGQTRELLAWPSAGDWQARISVADIAADGPFSAFPGVDRHFAVIEGAGVLLRFADRRAMLTPDSAPLAFDGGDAPGCDLLGGETRDLNLMVRRDAGRGSLQRVTDGDEWLSAAPLRAVFTRDAARLQIDDADAARLPPWTLAFSPHGTRQRWRLFGDGGPATAWWLDYRPKAA